MDWKSLIGELRATGLTRAEIAHRTGCGTSTIADLETLEGREPRHSLGQQLIQLHAACVKTTRAAKPSKQEAA